MCIVGGYVFFYMCPPRFAKAGGHPTIRAATRAATRGTPGRSRSVVCGMKLSRFLCALLLFFVNDADERHGRQLLSYRLSGPRELGQLCTTKLPTVRTKLHNKISSSFFFTPRRKVASQMNGK